MATPTDARPRRFSRNGTTRTFNRPASGMFRGALMGADAGAMTADGPSREGGEQAVVWGDFCSEIFCGARVRVKQRKVP